MKRARLLTMTACGLAAVAVWSGTAIGSEHTGVEVEHLNADPATAAPYSDAVRAGSTLYLAGNLGLDADGNLVAGGITPESEQTMENLRAVLEANGSSLDRVTNCEVMLADIKERDAFNEVYKKYWEQGKFPARHAFGVTGLYAGARVEIACIAIVK